MASRAVLVLGAVLLPWVAGTMQPAMAEEFVLQERLAPGQLLNVKNLNGPLRVEGTDGEQFEVRAVKRSRRGQENLVKIVVERSSEGLIVCTVYPASRPEGCRGGHSSSMSEPIDVSVEFRVRVPASIRFKGQTVNGSIEGERLPSGVSLSTINGSVRASTSGFIEAATVNGSLDIELGRTNWSGPLTFKTVNGSINVLLPADAGTEIEARTVQGRILSDFGLGTSENRPGRKRLTGTIGSGGRELDLTTVNGSIEIRSTEGRRRG